MGLMPGGPFVRLKPRAALVAVPRDLGDHLPEAERDDGEVVPP